MSDDYKLQMLVAARYLNRPDHSGLIYYIACPETNRLKIGYTGGSPVARLRALRTGSPTAISLMAVHPGNLADEQFIHNCFADQRVHGEWFQMTDHLFDHVAYVCWVAALEARHRAQAVPEWAELGVAAFEEVYGPLPTGTGSAVH